MRRPIGGPGTQEVRVYGVVEQAREHGAPQASDLSAWSIALYHGCRGDRGAEAQQQAYADLGRYLYNLVRRRFGDLPAAAWEDAVQSTLERVFRKIDQCQQPITFLAFVAQHLLASVRELRRRELRPHLTLDGDGAEEPIQVADPGASPEALVVQLDQQRIVLAVLERFARRHPRAKLQAQVLRLAYLHGLQSEEIAERLNIPVGSVYTARSRAIDTIQHDDDLRLLAADLQMDGGARVWQGPQAPAAPLIKEG